MTLCPNKCGCELEYLMTVTDTDTVPEERYDVWVCPKCGHEEIDEIKYD